MRNTLILLVALLAGCSSGSGTHDSTPTVPNVPTPVLTSLAVALSPTTIQVGQTSNASATGRDQNGGLIAVGAIAWSSNSALVATVNANGVVTGLAAGQAQITASSGGKQGLQLITVTAIPVAKVTVTPSNQTLPIGGTQQLAATTTDASDNILTGRAITWSSSDTTKVSVNASGLATALAAGSATITATSEFASGTALITVSPPPVATVAVAPSNPSVGVGGTQLLTATLRDASGNLLTGRTITWTTSDASKASVSASGLVTGVAVGSATITATSEGKTGTATVTVAIVPVASITLSAPSASLLVGGTLTLTATAFDAGGNVLTGRVFTWSSSNPAVVGEIPTANTAALTALSAGTSTITATSEGKSGTSLITVATSAQSCSSANALQVAVGQVTTLTAAQIASLCIGGGSLAAEYVLIPFNSSTVAATTVPLTITGTNTTAIIVPPAGASQQRITSASLVAQASQLSAAAAGEATFRAMERQQLSSRFTQVSRSGFRPSTLTGVASTPTVGSIVSLNASITGNLCAVSPLHGARIVAVLPHTIVLVDTIAPAGGYSNAELTAFGTAFDTLGFGLDTLNFGAPTDIDGNGRVAIFFTPGVNVLPAPPGGVILGVFGSRDLLPATGAGACAGSNFGEMFYMPVPDLGGTFNSAYTDKTFLSNGVTGTLVHEFQHLINAGRRLYVNPGVTSLEEVWLNEGLSHIAEELLYYRISGNSPRSNINLALVQSTPAQLAAINGYEVQNLGRLRSYMQAPEVNSPYSQVDALQMRGAIWQLLRYSADRKGGSEQSTWFALVNSSNSGQANFNAVFGDIITNARDWAVAQFIDDAGLGATGNFTNPSWNFRTLMPALNSGVFPLLTRPLLSSPLNITLDGGGAAYIRFRVSANTAATVISTSSGVAVPAGVNFMLVRTQ